MSIMDLPEGAKDSDLRWQMGYDHAERDLDPISEDPVYVSGWCNGYSGYYQCNRQDAEAAYVELQQRPKPLEPIDAYKYDLQRMINHRDPHPAKVVMHYGALADLVRAYPGSGKHDEHPMTTEDRLAVWENKRTNLLKAMQ